MRNKKLRIIMVITLFAAFSVVAVNASEYRAERASQVEMMERHQDEREELRETHRADMEEMRKLHRKELNLLLERQKEERSAERRKRLGYRGFQ
jgi:membrane protein involved in colicin uptake